MQAMSSLFITVDVSEIVHLFGTTAAFGPLSLTMSSFLCFSIASPFQIEDGGRVRDTSGDEDDGFDECVDRNH